MLKSALYMVRFLINHPESGYDHRTGDFDLLCAIKFFQKTCASINAARFKKAEILKSVRFSCVMFFLMLDFSLTLSQFFF